MTINMELDELKNLWQAEHRNLNNRIKLNEELLMKMNMEKSAGDINKIVSVSVFGRNMALIYCLVSIGLAVSVIELIEYSIPAILGALAMLWSFISHLSIKKPDYKDSIIQLHKTICNFKIHLAANAKYDIIVVAFWFLSVVPIFLNVAYNVSLYDNNQVLAVFCLVAGIVLTLTIILSRKAYAECDRQLKITQDQLAELIEFEKNNLR